MVVARRFLQVMFAAGMVVGSIVASNGGEDQAPARPRPCAMVSRQVSRSGSANIATRR